MSNEATEKQAINALPPDANPLALAPIDDAKEPDYKSLLDNQDFKDHLNKIADYATRQSNSSAMWERRRKAVTLRKYILGYFYGVFDKTKGFVSGKEEGDGIYFDPQTPTVIDVLVASLVKTKPQKKCEARSGDERIDKREAARVAEKLLQMDDDQDFTPKKQQREWKWNLLAAGETYRITYFNTNKQGCGFDEDQYEVKVIKGGDTASYCPICGSTGTDEANKCVNCKNPQMDTFTAKDTTVSLNKGSKYQQVGDVDWDSPDSLEMTVIGETDDISEALIVKRDRMIPRCVLEDALRADNLPDTDTPESLNYKQMFVDTQGGEGMKEFRLLHYEEFWVAPAVIASYAFPNDTPMEGGGTVRASTKGKDLFPNGFFFSRVKKDIREVFPQSIGECLSHCSNSIGEGFHGQGEWDLIELQDQATEAKSMKMNSMLLDSTQPLVVREEYIDAENFENKFGLVLPTDLPLEHGLSELMSRVPAGRAPAEAYSLGEEIKGEIQQREGTFSTQSDAPDIKAMGTATGISAITNQAVGRRGPALQLYAQMEVDQAYQKLELRQKYWCKKMYQPIAKELGGDAVKWFMDCNIRQDLNIKVVPGSWMPMEEDDKKAGFKDFLAIAGQIIAAKGDPKMLDDVLRKANEIFGGGIDFADYETQSIEAQLRLDKLRDVGAFVEQQFGQALYGPDGSVNEEAIGLAYLHTADLLKITHEKSDAEDIFAKLPLDVMFDTHTEFEEAYTDWLTTADGRAASSFIRTLVRQLADFHVQAEAYRQYKLKQYANIAQVPDLQANLVEQDAMHSQASDHAQQDAANAPPPDAGPYPKTPPKKVSESMNYKDAPDVIKRQMEAEEGYQPAFGSPTPNQEQITSAEHQSAGQAVLNHANKQLDRTHKEKLADKQAQNKPPAGGNQPPQRMTTAG